MLKKRTCMLLALLLAVMMIAACTPTTQPSASQPAVSTSSAQAPASAPASAATPETNAEPVSFTWFRSQINRNAIVYWNDALWIQELQNRLNVEINFEGPLVGATSNDYIQAVNVLLNSGDYPDALHFDWVNYSGGLAGAIDDGIVVNVSQNPDYWARMPHWQGIMEANDTIRRSCTLDDGSSALFNHVEESTNRSCYNGYALREDWLEQVGKDVPTTIDELYDIFVAFKEAFPDTYPMTDESGLSTIANLAPAWGMKRNTPYPDPDTGKMTYWTMYKNGEAFTDFVTTLNKWYNEGLLDPDFPSNDWGAREARMTGQKSGFSFLLPQQYASWKESIVAANPELEGTVHFVGLEPLIGPAGKSYNTNGMKSWGGGTAGNVVTTAAEKAGKVEAILSVFDYMYSPEGTDLNGWGVEGVSYTVNADGKKEWTEKVTNDPTFNFGDAVFMYAIPTWGDWPKLMSYEAWLSQETKDPDSLRAHQNYLKGDPGLSMPGIQLNSEESEEYNRIRADANTLIDEYFSTLVTGIRPLSDISTLFSELEKMGLPRAMEIYQGAYDRYMAK